MFSYHCNGLSETFQCIRKRQVRVCVNIVLSFFVYIL
jgi:hypothetical protein